MTLGLQLSDWLPNSLLGMPRSQEDVLGSFPFFAPCRGSEVDLILSSHWPPTPLQWVQFWVQKTPPLQKIGQKLWGFYSRHKISSFLLLMCKLFSNMSELVSKWMGQNRDICHFRLIDGVRGENSFF